MRLRSSASTLLCRLPRRKETGRYSESFALWSVTIHWPPPPRVVIVIPLMHPMGRSTRRSIPAMPARPVRQHGTPCVSGLGLHSSTPMPACRPNDYVIIYYAHVICRRCPPVSTCSRSSRRCHRHRHRHQRQQHQLKLACNDNSESNGQRRFTWI